MKKARLGVNIDHVATIRQARGEGYPDISRAAQCAIEHGADQITIHLREDRRHIQDADCPAVKKVTQLAKIPLNLELSTSAAMMATALELRPEWVCLVPERRQELTTEGGLNLQSDEVYQQTQVIISELAKHSPQTRVSLFLDDRPESLQRAWELKVHAVEIHTGEYARDYLAFQRGELALTQLQKHVDNYRRAINYLKQKEMGAHAGHGLTQESLAYLLKHLDFEEYNIGHWIVAESIFIGLGTVVGKLRRLIDENC